MSGGAKSFAKTFDRHKTDECLLGQAQLCERIARACSDEQSAQKFRDLAHSETWRNSAGMPRRANKPRIDKLGRKRQLLNNRSEFR